MKSLQTISSGAARFARAAFTRQSLIMLSVAFASLLVVPGVINQKASAIVDCNSGFLCLYKDVNYGGGAPLPIFLSPGDCYTLSGGWNNVTSSYKSRLLEGTYVYLYDGACDTNPWLSNTPNSQSSWVGAAWNDRVSSVKLY